MTVQPYQSPQDPHPFNPNDTSGGGGGGGGTIPKGSQVPDLAMVFVTAPDFTPDPGAGSGSSSTPQAPVSDFSIDLGSLRTGETAMLQASSAIVSAYENLKSLFESDKDTVFGQQATDTTPLHGDDEFGNASDVGSTTSPDPIQAAAQAFADGQNGGPGMNDIEAYTLQQVANAMGLLGQFMAMMNAAGYSYSQADASAVVPPPGSGS